MAKNNTVNQYKLALEKFLTSRVVSYHPMLARMVGGAKAAIFLDQCLYWKDKIPPEKDGWFYKSVADMEEETGLTKLEQQTARAILERAGILETKLKGIPRVYFYRVNMDRLLTIISDPAHWVAKPSNGKPSQYQAGKPSNIKRQSRPISDGKPTQLNKESESTSLDYSHEITSSSSEDNRAIAGEEEEGRGERLSEDIKRELIEIGVFDSLFPEIERAGFDEQSIHLLIVGAREKEPTPPKTAGVFMYRLRNTPRQSPSVKPPADREAENRRGYVTGEYSDFINH